MRQVTGGCFVFPFAPRIVQVVPKFVCLTYFVTDVNTITPINTSWIGYIILITRLCQIRREAMTISANRTRSIQAETEFRITMRVTCDTRLRTGVMLLFNIPDNATIDITVALLAKTVGTARGII
jgi:hypothetical protein